jgi:hypothetical protein
MDKKQRSSQVSEILWCVVPGVDNRCAGKRVLQGTHAPRQPNQTKEHVTDSRHFCLPAGYISQTKPSMAWKAPAIFRSVYDQTKPCSTWAVPTIFHCLITSPFVLHHCNNHCDIHKIMGRSLFCSVWIVFETDFLSVGSFDWKTLKHLLYFWRFINSGPATNLLLVLNMYLIEVHLLRYYTV